MCFIRSTRILSISCSPIQLVCHHQYKGLKSHSVECEDDPGPCKLNFEGDLKSYHCPGAG